MKGLIALNNFINCYIFFKSYQVTKSVGQNPKKKNKKQSVIHQQLPSNHDTNPRRLHFFPIRTKITQTKMIISYQKTNSTQSTQELLVKMEGRSLAAPSKRFVRASSTMTTVGSLALIASDITIILCIVGLCNLIGSNLCPTSSHWSLAVKNRVSLEQLVGTPRACTHKITQIITPSHPQRACVAVTFPCST